MYISKRSSAEINMTDGAIGKTLLIFTLPLFLSQILQQFYSIADCMILGHFGGRYGMAAAGVGGLVLSVIINFFIGFSTGISAVTATLFGSGKYSDLKKMISTLLLLSAVLGMVLTLAGILNAHNFLLWLNCPDEILLVSKEYLQICFLGMTPLLIYNIGNAILRSLGNTKSALGYLLISSFLNLVLTLILVIYASAGLRGAAWAAVISQWILAFLMLRKLFLIDPAYRLSFRQKLLKLHELGKILNIGMPSGMQAVFMSISSLVIQTSINQFGADAVAGMTVYARVEGFLYYPTFSYGMALTGFIGQNLGAGRLDRIRRAMSISIKAAAGFTLAAGILLAVCSGHMLMFFTSEPGILYYGEQAILYIFPFYFFYAVNQVYIGGLKGLGKTGYPMLCSLICYCLFRVVWCRLLLLYWWDMRVIYSCYNVSCILMIILLRTGYRRTYRRL